MIPKTLIERFNAKWRDDPETGCWIWTASTAGKGYGQIKIPGTRRQVYAHQLSWKIHRGPIPADLLVCHECDTPRCVNPAHLFLGTSGDNLQDMAAKDRHLRGERNAKAKLTEADVLRIYALSDAGKSAAQIAKELGIVKQPRISQILRGVAWRHLFERRRGRA
jgi:hypothetical protein